MSPQFLQAQDLLVEFYGALQIVNPVTRMQQFLHDAHGFTIAAIGIKAIPGGRDGSDGDIKLEQAKTCDGEMKNT